MAWMFSGRRRSTLLLCILAGLAAVPPCLAGSADRVFSGAVGFGTETSAGRGGRVIKVTNLNRSGPGSFAEAVQAKGPRIVVFEVGGVIDLDRHSVRITEPMVTVAGQTAPSPGITFIRGGISITTHDVLVQHIRVRTGDAGQARKSGWECDAIGLGGGAWNVVIDHCSAEWATDENLSASGPRFEGDDVEQWRRHTSHNVTFSQCIIAEGLSNSSHGKGEHSKGSLIHDNATRIAMIGNLYACNVQRNPLFKGGVRGVVANNLIYNPGNRAVHYCLVTKEWGSHPHVAGQMSLVGNVLRYGPDTRDNVPMVSYDGGGPLELYADDNQATDLSGKPGPVLAVRRGSEDDLHRLTTPPLWPAGFQPMPAEQVAETVLLNAGARPWDRDEIDRRIVLGVREKTGRIIDSQEQVGGYPAPAPTTRPLEVPQEGIDAWLESFCRPAQ